MSASQPVRTLLIGYGYWGSRFLGIAGKVDRLEVVGVVDARAGQAGFVPPPGLPCTADLSAALADPTVEAAIVTTPATSHTEPATQVLLAGKHLYIEKPFALTTRDTDELLALAKDSDRMVTVDHQYWWSSEVLAMEQAVKAGEIGKVVAMSAERAGDGPVRDDVGALWDLAVHDVSILVRLGAARGELRVDSCIEVADGPVAGCTSMTGRTSAEVAFSLHACWLSDQRHRLLVVAGTAGSVRLEETDQTVEAWLVKDGRRKLLSSTAKSAPRTPIELGLSEFAAGVRGRPDLSKAIDAGVVVGAMEQLQSTARPLTRTVRSPRCWR